MLVDLKYLDKQIDTMGKYIALAQTAYDRNSLQATKDMLLKVKEELNVPIKYKSIMLERK